MSSTFALTLFTLNHLKHLACVIQTHSSLCLAYTLCLPPACKAPAVVIRSEWANVQRWAKIPELSCESHHIISVLIGQCVCKRAFVCVILYWNAAMQRNRYSMTLHLNEFTFSCLKSVNTHSKKSCAGIRPENPAESLTLCDSHTHTSLWLHPSDLTQTHV